MSEVLFQVTIHGRPRVKKNSKRIFASGNGRVRVLSSEQFTAWEKDAILAIRSRLNEYQFMQVNTPRFPEFPIKGPIEAEFKFYFQNRHGEADTSNLIEGPQDVLEKVGVIDNDRIIKRVIGEKFFGSEPRTEVILRTLEGEIE